MPAYVDSDPETLRRLLDAAPTGSHAVEDLDRLQAWLDHHPGEYAVVLGPTLDLDPALDLCDRLRTARPTLSLILVRHELETSTLSRAIKAGVRDVLAADDLASMTAAVERAHELYVALRGPDGARQTGKVITVFSPKGGVGKTTMAVNLALALTERGARRVCLVDLDLAFGDVAITMQLFPSHTIEHAIGSEGSLDQEMVGSLLTRHADSMMVLAAPAQPDVRDRITAPLVATLVRTLKETFDYVVIDTAPAFDEQTLTALDETDECVIVATLDVPTLKNVKVAIETLDLLDIARDHRHLLLNRADEAVGLGPDKVETILGMAVATQVATSVDIAAATNAGSPIVVAKPEHPSSVAVRRLASLLAGEPVASPRALPHDVGESDHPTPRASRRFLNRRAS